MVGRHEYAVSVRWTGNRGSGTSSYRDFDRAMTVAAEGTPDLLASADPVFRGDASRWNPELLLLAALSQCHLLSYLHLCSSHGVVVESYVDDAIATMEVSAKSGGHFTSATLRPSVAVREESTVETAKSLHVKASENCFIANSVNFPVGHEPVITVVSRTDGS